MTFEFSIVTKKKKKQNRKKVKGSSATRPSSTQCMKGAGPSQTVYDGIISRVGAIIDMHASSIYGLEESLDQI